MGSGLPDMPFPQLAPNNKVGLKYSAGETIKGVCGNTEESFAIFFTKLQRMLYKNGHGNSKECYTNSIGEYRGKLSISLLLFWE